MEAARSVQGLFGLNEMLRAGAVGAAIQTPTGDIYTGISIELACGIGFCAEHSAVAELLKDRTTLVEAMVAVGPDGIIPPCGRCRELLLQINAENRGTKVVIAEDQVALLGDLLPYRWY